jgi:hypothetical protein
MSTPLPDVTVPDSSSRFNLPTGAGFVSWFAALRASINVAMVEVRNQSVARAGEVAEGAVSTSKSYTDETVHTAINVSGLALDADGTPYFEPGSMYPRVLVDTDGIPYFREL